jgi:endonuclease/exonuclease/phosphatase family metal-dependent hydrolase
MGLNGCTTAIGICAALALGGLSTAPPSTATTIARPASLAGAPPSARASSGPVTLERVARSTSRPVRLSVMTQNIFYGGDDYDLATGDFCEVADGCPKALHRLARIIRRSGADVVGVQEPERNVERLAHILGWHGSNRAHVISRYPLIDPPHSRGLYLFVEPSPGRVVAVANVHLPSTPYGPYEVRDGANRRQLLNVERSTRLPFIRDQLRVLPRLVRRGIPVVMTGDFNSPSHLDWTRAVAAVRSDVPFAFRWPVSAALARAGFVDTYREAHPDPVVRPGFTWTPGGPETVPREVFDRIDWVLHAGAATTLRSRLVGEKGEPDVGLGVRRPYPSDHRGVVSTLRITPARAPTLVSVADRAPVVGRPLAVAFQAPGHPGERVAIVRREHGGGRKVVVSASTGRHSPDRGRVRLGTASLNERKYHVALLGAHGRTLSKTPVWAYHRDTEPTIEASRRRYEKGESIKLSWTRSAGMGLDWVSLFPCTKQRCAGNGGYTLYDYTDSQIEGSVRIGPGDSDLEGGATWPLKPGTYVARLLVDDSYVDLAQSSRIRITRR